MNLQRATLQDMERRTLAGSAKNVWKHAIGLGALVTGFIAIIFASPPRSFNVSIGDYDSSEAGVAHADAPYAQSTYYAESAYSCDTSCDTGGCGCGEGEGK